MQNKISDLAPREADLTNNNNDKHNLMYSTSHLRHSFARCKQMDMTKKAISKHESENVFPLKGV